MTTEYVIPDLVTASLEFDCTTTPEKGVNGVRKFSAFAAKMKAACLPPRDQPIFFNGRALKPVYASSDGLASGCFWAGSDEDGGEGEIILAPVGQESARIRIGVKLTRAQDGEKAWSEVEINPATMILGSNIHPAAFTNPQTGKNVPCPSSDWGAMSRTFRLGFEFLEQVTDGQIFPESTKLAIASGDFHLVRVQWACAKPTKDVRRVLQLLTVVYDQTIARGHGIINNAAHLGLEFTHYLDHESHHLTGVLFQKRHGKKLVFSASIYDKAARLQQMQQPIDQLDGVQTVTVKESVREDITAHSEGIIIIAKKAQKKLQTWGKAGIEYFDFISPDVFLRDEPKSTLWWLQRAVFILSHYRQEGNFKRFSFGVWLIPYIETDILHFDVIAGITAEGFHRALALRDPVALAWRSFKIASSVGWADRLAEAAKCSPATVYNRRAALKAALGIDFALPFQFYADVLHMGQASTAKPENIVKMLTAAKIQDGDALARLYREALADFENSRLTILNPFLVSRPRAMRLEHASKSSESDLTDAHDDFLDNFDGLDLPKRPAAKE
jgi:hypothetical protein